MVAGPSKQASKRLGVEYKAITKEPPPFVFARPDESNILSWHYILRGPTDTPYEGGEYWGIVTFPSDYPFAPPGIKMMTPSGRFSPNTAICTSFSNFHPGSWNPAWSAASIFTGLLSFMVSDEHTTGSMKGTKAEREALASASHAWNLTQPKFKSMFPEYATPQMVNLPNMGPPPALSTSKDNGAAGAGAGAPSGVATSPFPSIAQAEAAAKALAAGVDPKLVLANAGQPIDKAKKAGGGGAWRRGVTIAGVVLLVSWGVMKVLE